MRQLALALLALVLTGCIGAYRTTPLDPVSITGLAPTFEDVDGGMVGVAPTFRLGQYPVLLVERFTVKDSEVKDDEDRRLAESIPYMLQTDIIQRLRSAKVFERVVNVAEGGGAPDGVRALRLTATITRLEPGNRALRYFVGFGAGAARAQFETRLVDAHTGDVMVVTADRREASFGIFGGDSEDHLREATSDTARDFVKFLTRLRENDAVASGAEVPLAGRWRQRGRQALLTIATGRDGLIWEYESRATGAFGDLRAGGKGSATGADIALTGVITASHGFTANRPYTFTLKRDGRRLTGTLYDANNTPRPVEFERAP